MTERIEQPAVPASVELAQPSPAEVIAARLDGAGLAATELLTVKLGDTLGYYRCLAERPGQSPDELAAATSTHPRYVREWLQSQAVSGFCLAAGDDPATARFSLAEGVAEVLVDPVSPCYLAPMATMLTAAAAVIPQLIAAYRSGEGVPYSDYPEGMIAQAGMNRPAFANELASWVAAIPDVASRLADTANPAAVADLACGAGWSTIALANAYPHIDLVGVDNDPASLSMAAANAAAAGVADRIRFVSQDLVAQVPPNPAHDVVFFFECVHDFPRPVEVLRNARDQLKPDGTVIVMDERTADQFTAPGDESERFLAALSALWCLPQGLFGPHPEPVGTLLRADTMRDLAQRAGYSSTDVLDIDHDVFRFYRLTP
jgi:SAM-dependent methyltransferase